MLKSMISIQLPVNDYAFLVDSTPEIEMHLLNKFHPFVLTTDKDAKYKLFLKTTNNSLTIYNNDHQILSTKETTSDFDSYKLIIAVLRDTTIAKNDQCIMHGSYIDFRGKGILLLGESGAGKSTLSAFLSTKEMVKCYADDIVIVDQNEEVRCLSKYLYLRKPSTLLEGLSNVSYVYDDFLQRFSMKLSNTEEKKKIDEIFILMRDNNNNVPYMQNDPNPLTTLLHNMYLPCSIRSNFAIAARLASRKSVRQLHYYDLESVYDFLKNV